MNNVMNSAMVAHKESHDRDDFVKIAEIQGGCTKGGYRPETHTFDALLEKCHKGSDANYTEIFIPPSRNYDGEHIKCKSCKKYKIKFSEELSFHTKCRRVEKMRSHELFCKL